MTASSNRVSLDIDKLLKPISEQSPAGDSLRYDPLWDEIKDHRREDDATLPQGVWETKRKTADWAKVVRVGRKALESHSKDLQVAAWLGEGLACKHGIVGMWLGLAAMRRICETYWADMHPRIEDGDLEERVGIIEWMDRRYAELLCFSALTGADNVKGRRLEFAEWEGLLERERRGGTVGADEVTRQQFEQAVRNTPTEFYVDLAAQLVRLREEIALLSQTLDTLGNGTQFSLRLLAQEREKLDRKLHVILTERGVSADATEDEVEEQGEEETEFDLSDDELRAGDVEEGGPGSAEDLTEIDISVPQQEGRIESATILRAPLPQPFSGVIRSRKEAFTQLSRVADFLAETEPHSPTSYLIRRAVRWGGMQLPDLLRELMSEQNDLQAILGLLGVGKDEQ